MSVNISFSLTKYIFFFVNFIFWIFGCGSLGVGVWLYVVKSDYLNFTPNNYGALSAAGLCIAAGAAVIIIGLVGCCGAWIESRCLLLTYFLFILLVFVVELTVGVLGFLYRDEVSEVIRIELYSHLHSPYVADSATDPQGLRITWDNLQQEVLRYHPFHCCGVDNFKDWYRSSVRWPQNDWVPDSCCDPVNFKNSVDALKNCGKVDKPELWFQKGCYTAFSNWLLEHLHVVGIVGLLLSFTQIFALIGALVLFCGIREKQQALRRPVRGKYNACNQRDEDNGRPAWDTVS